MTQTHWRVISALLREHSQLHTQTPATTGHRPEHHPPSLLHPASQHPAISSPETAPGSTDPSCHHQHHLPSNLRAPQKHCSSLLTKHQPLSWFLSFRDVLHTAKVCRQSASSLSPAGKGRMQHLRKVIKGTSWALSLHLSAPKVPVLPWAGFCKPAPSSSPSPPAVRVYTMTSTQVTHFTSFWGLISSVVPLGNELVPCSRSEHQLRVIAALIFCWALSSVAGGTTSLAEREGTLVTADFSLVWSVIPGLGWLLTFCTCHTASF